MDYNNEFAAKLSEKSGRSFTSEEIDGWHTGEGSTRSQNAIDAALRKVMGKSLFDAGDSTARLDQIAFAFLSGEQTVTVGGMKFSWKINPKTGQALPPR